MKSNIAIIIPHKGLGDMIFHYKFVNSIYNHHKTKLTIVANKSSKADLIFKKNKKIEKVITLNLRRPHFLNYISRIIILIRVMLSNKFEIIYYTGFNKWHRTAFSIIKLFKNINIKYYKNSFPYILSFLDFFLKKEKIKIDHKFNINISNNTPQNFRKKIGKQKKPWVFLSIDTSEDQIQIPTKFLDELIERLKKKYNTIFINTNSNNKRKYNFISNKSFIKTDKYNILKIAYLIQKSKVFIGNESGPAIIAAINKKKSIIFFSKNIKKESSKMPNSYLRNYINIADIKKNKNKLFNII